MAAPVDVPVVVEFDDRANDLSARHIDSARVLSKLLDLQIEDLPTNFQPGG